MCYNKQNKASEVRGIKNKAIVRICAVAFMLNFILFTVKLYVGLSSNIISIYSDGINNLFDALSCVVSVLCFVWAAKSRGHGISGIVSRTEQLLTLGLSVIVSASGAVFAYNSLERLMYPTPMWFSVKFLWALIGTALCKLVMYFMFLRQHKILGSQVLRIMALDCRLDFFVNLVTILTLVMSKLELYAVDAFGGIAISIIIVISGVQMLMSSARRVVGVPEREKRQILCDVLSEFGLDESSCQVDFAIGDEYRAYVRAELTLSDGEKELLKLESLQKTGINIYFIK